MIRFEVADFAAFFDAFTSNVAAFREGIGATLQQYADAYMEVADVNLRDVTPQSGRERTDEDGPTLQESTIPTGYLAAGNTLSFQMEQPAESAPNEDGSGGGTHYAQFLIQGRGAIDAPSDGPWSTGKQALHTPWGLRKRVKGTEPDPYPTEAIPADMTAFEAIALTYSEDVATFLLRGFA